METAKHDSEARLSEMVQKITEEQTEERDRLIGEVSKINFCLVKNRKVSKLL